MQKYVKIANIQVAEMLYDFINTEALPGSNVDREKFWADFDQLIHDLEPENKALLNRRVELQKAINAWHKENPNYSFDQYKSFLEEIGYLEGQVEDFEVSTQNVD